MRGGPIRDILTYRTVTQNQVEKCQIGPRGRKGGQKLGLPPNIGYLCRTAGLQGGRYGGRWVRRGTLQGVSSVNVTCKGTKIERRKKDASSESYTLKESGKQIESYARSMQKPGCMKQRGKKGIGTKRGEDVYYEVTSGN